MVSSHVLSLGCTCGLKQTGCAGLGFAECTARVVPLADDELTTDKPYLNEHEEVQSRGWVYYVFNVTDDDYQVVVNVAEEEGSQCKPVCIQASCSRTLCCLSFDHGVVDYFLAIEVAFKPSCIIVRCTLSALSCTQNPKPL